MSQRTIDTVLRVQNESGYKSALRNCTAELKVQKTELERVTSEYRTNANSMEALTKKGDVLFRMYDTQQQKIELLREAMEQAQNTRDTERETLASLRDQYDQAQKKLATLKEQVDETSQEFQEQKAAVDELRDSVIQHQAKLDASTKSYSYYAAQLNKAEVELDNLGDKQDEVTQLLNEAKSSADGCATSIDKYGDAVRESAEASEQSGSAVEAMAQAMVASGVQQKVEDLAAEMMKCSNAAQDFEVSMAQVGTIADSSVLSKRKLAESVVSLSTDLRKLPEEVSAAMYDALSAGVETADVLNFTAQSSQLATAGFTDMSTSVDVLTTILNAYKLKSSETEKVASTLVKTQDLGKITVDDLGKVMGRVIPAAAAYRVDLNNIAAAYANMTAAGVNAENTTTNLTAMLDELADGGSDVAVILAEQTGKTFSELMNEGNSLADVLEIIGASVEYDQVQFSNLWSSSTAGKAAISLFDGSARAFNATLEQMINSSGTVAKNYEKMTDTSEYSSQRLEVASKNLQIAVGDSLNPVLDELRESGGAVLEKATEIIRQNPALVSVITGTVTALGLLAAGVSGLMVVKSVTTAMQALNITMAANPAVLVTTALVGLAAAAATYLAQVESTEERVESLTEASRGLSETVEAGKTSYEDTMLSAQAAADTVSGYIDRLAELEAQGELTDVQQAEYSILLEKISSLMPGINMELDAQTGLLKGGTEALRRQADAWKNAAIEEAAYARYKDDITALADAEYELAKNQALLNMAQDEAADITARYNDVQRQMEENLQGIQDICDDTTLSYEEQQAAINALAAENDELDLSLYDMRTALEENAKEQEVYAEAVKQGEQAMSEATPEIEAATEAYNKLSQTTQNASVDTGTAASNMADAVSEAALEAQAAYDEMYLSALSSLNQQIGLFEDLSGKCEMTTDEMIQNLLSQKEAFDNYATNIQLAMERGIDQGLVQELSDGSAQSMQILAELVGATDEQIAELNSALAGVSEGKENVATAMADLSAAVNQGMEDAVSAAEQQGQNVVEGLIRGVRYTAPRYNEAIVSVAEGGKEAYRKSNVIKSPSQKYRQLAQHDVEGLIVQYKADKPKIAKAAAELADAGYEAQIRARQMQIPSLATAAAAVPAGGNDGGVSGMLRQILTKLAEGQRIVLYPDILIGKTAGSYDAELGQIQFMTDRGAY